MQFYVMTRTHVRQLTQNDAIVQYREYYLVISHEKATVCASTGENQHNCAPTKWGITEITVSIL